MGGNFEGVNFPDGSFITFMLVFFMLNGYRTVKRALNRENIILPLLLRLKLVSSVPSQLTKYCSNSETETLEKDVKYVFPKNTSRRLLLRFLK